MLPFRFLKAAVVMVALQHNFLLFFLLLLFKTQGRKKTILIVHLLILFFSALFYVYLQIGKHTFLSYHISSALCLKCHCYNLSLKSLNSVEASRSQQ